MNRTTLLLVAAAGLAAIALVTGRGPAAPAPVFVPVSPVPLVVAPPASTVAVPSQVGPLTLATQLSSSRVAAGTSYVYAKVDVSAGQLENRVVRVPVNLAIAIDRSGSMNGGKMEDAKRAATALLDQLLPGDRLSIVAFDDRIEVFPSAMVTPASKELMRRFISRIHEAGSTNISDALTASYGQLRSYASEYKVSRVVLLSDGQPTAGLTDAPSLKRLADQARASKVSTSAFGIGLDFNATLMSELASHGGGSYAFVENAANLGLAFAHELGDAAQLVARDVRVSIEPPQGVEVEEIAGHTFTRQGNNVLVPTYDFGPGQTAQMLVRLKVNAPAAGNISLGDVRLTYVDVQADKLISTANPMVALATPNANDVTAYENKQVMEMAKAVDITRRVQQAQQAYQRGDTKSAFDIMASTRALFGASADALAGDDSVLEGAWRKGGDDARRADMELTRKTMKNFGQNNASAY